VQLSVVENVIGRSIKDYKMTKEQLDGLSNVNEKYLGYGEPSETTIELLKEGYLTIQEKEEENRKYWYASLTKKGKKVVSTFFINQDN
jgi:hypothetical protein